MFTVKHIMSGGRESVRQATEVDYYPKGAPGNGYNTPVFFAGLPGGGSMTYEFGHIYVMNENGKTVASYELGVEPEAVAVAA